MSAIRRAQSAVAGLGLAILVGCASRAPAPPVEAAESPPAVELSVRVTGAVSDDGFIAVAVYGSSETFAGRRDPIAATRLEPAGGSAVWRLPGLPPGRYAVAAYHDLDGDGGLDRSTAGAPTEPYGFSNGARGRFGPPSFDDAAVVLAGGAVELEIILR